MTKFAFVAATVNNGDTTEIIGRIALQLPTFSSIATACVIIGLLQYFLLLF